MKQISVLAGLLCAAALADEESGQSLFSSNEGYDYAQKNLGVEIVFGSTPKEEADVEQLNILQSWLDEGSFEGFVVTPFRPTTLYTVLTMTSRKNVPIVNIDETDPRGCCRG